MITSTDIAEPIASEGTFSVWMGEQLSHIPPNKLHDAFDTLTIWVWEFATKGAKVRAMSHQRRAEIVTELVGQVVYYFKALPDTRTEDSPESEGFRPPREMLREVGYKIQAA